MSDIILKTYEFLDELDNSKMIKTLVTSKEKLLNNKKVLSLIEKYNSSKEEDKLKIKKELYKNEDYKNYMSSYSELSLIILKINKRYKKYTSSKSCVN